MTNYFFAIFAATVVLTLLIIYLYPFPAPTIKGFRTHHYMYGIFAVAVGLSTKSIVIYAIGMGLFIDELTYLVTRGKTHEDNYSKVSLLGTLLLVITVFVFRDYFVLPLTY